MEVFTFPVDWRGVSLEKLSLLHMLVNANTQNFIGHENGSRNNKIRDASGTRLAGM